MYQLNNESPVDANVLILFPLADISPIHNHSVRGMEDPENGYRTMDASQAASSRTKAVREEI